MNIPLSLMFAGLAAAITAQPILAAEVPYPSKPIRIIVGFPPAGAADIFARLVGQKLSEAWGQAVVVDNRPGAGSTIGSEIAANATPDGHTLMAVSASYATSAGLYKNLKYHPIKSFAPITMMVSNSNLLLAHPSVPAKSVRELVAFAKANPGKLTMGSAGTGSITHLAGELFASMAGIKVTHIPYKGGGPNLNAILGGEIQISIASVPASLGHVRAGRVKALGLTTLKRSAVLPEVPPIAEAGVPGYEAKNWYGILAPAATPPAIIAKLNRQINEILRAPDFVEAAVKQGAEVEGGTPEEFKKYLESEIAKWSKVIKAAGVQL
ncbi:MAG TPA: tripartite tricarboxylate transporter substrate binding protein [Burkholderiales bacterium]|jgi:tripartite-type tricarboxylate transporter receptor subunit TctC|nr:tripartite tricarboxylate transporter substrate binding protein [Burkholderiales bacterium]